MGSPGGSSGSKSTYKPNKDGYYGRKGGSKSSSRVRHLSGGQDGAKKFFENVTQGYTSEKPIGRGGKIRDMPDGSSITYRPISSSDGTPVVEFHGGNAKDQKIHFID